MDRSDMHSKSSDHESRSVRNLKRHDLVEHDFEDLDLKKINESTQVLNTETIVQGDIVGQEAIDTIEKQGKQIGSGHNATIRTVKIRRQWLACKTIWITVEECREAYEKEIECLLKLRKGAHWHVVQILGHYIDPTNEGHIILSPLAECDLEDFLDGPLTVRGRLMMQRWFGCLAAGLRFIHDHEIKHKDLKPENILIHGDNVVITDFGISKHFCGRSSSHGHCLGALLYQAPEVFAGTRRGRSQDVWALICCFIEMVSVLLGSGRTEFRTWCMPGQEWRFNFGEDYDVVVCWLKHLLSQPKAKEQLALLILLLEGFKIDKEDRPTATDLFNQLRGMPSFVGECCKVPISGSGSAGGTSSPSSPQNSSREPAAGHLLKFFSTFRKSTTDLLQAPAIQHSLDELVDAVERQEVRSLRSAEKKLLLYIAPVQCRTANEYLTFCKAFVAELANAAKSPTYRACLYNEEAGEKEQPYTTAYFTILIDVILSRCMTRQWNNTHDVLPTSILNRSPEANTTQPLGEHKSLGKAPLSGRKVCAKPVPVRSGLS